MDYYSSGLINDEYPAPLPQSIDQLDQTEKQNGSINAHIIHHVRSNGTTPTAKSKQPMPKKFEPPDGGYGWVVLIASFLIQAITGSVGYIQGMLYPEFLREFESGTVTTSWVSSIQIFFWFTTGMVTGPLVQTVGSRKVCWIGTVIIFVGLLGSAFAVHISMLFIFWGVITGLGMSFIFFPSVIIIQQYFLKKRSIAVAIANAGVPFGGFVMPPICNLLLQEYGWRGTILIMSGMALNVFVIAYFFKPLPKPKSERRHEKTLEELITQSVMSLKGVATSTSKAKDFINRFLDLSLLKNPSMFLDMFAYGFYSFGFIAFAMFIPMKARIYDIADPKPIWLLSMIGISDVCGRFVSGVAGQFLGQKRLAHYMISMMMGGFATAVSSVIYKFPGLSFCACLFGLSTGMTRAYSSIVLTDLLGLSNLPKAYGFKLFLNGVTVLASAPFAAMLMGVTDSINLPFLVIGSMQAMGGVTILVLLILLKCGCTKWPESSSLL